MTTITDAKKTAQYMANETGKAWTVYLNTTIDDAATCSEDQWDNRPTEDGLEWIAEYKPQAPADTLASAIDAALDEAQANETGTAYISWRGRIADCTWDQDHHEYALGMRLYTRAEMFKILTDELDEVQAPEPEDNLLDVSNLVFQITEAYTAQSQAREWMYQTGCKIDQERRDLERHQHNLRLEAGYTEYKNDDVRKTYLRSNSQGSIGNLESAEIVDAHARHKLAQATADVEYTRALLRLAELAAGIQEKRER